MNRFATLTALTAAATLTTTAAFGDTQTERVEAYDTDTFTWTAHETGEVVISIDGDGDTDLDLFVYDRRGNQLGSDLSLDDNEQVRFHAREGRTYEFEVQNLGDIWNRYDMEIQMVSDTISDRVEADDTMTYTYEAPQCFSEMVLTLHGDGDTDLDLTVYDSHGNTVATGLSMDDHERLVVPTEPGAFYEIVVRNYGNVWNAFTLDLDD